MEKTFRTIDEQINILKSKNISIKNLDNAQSILTDNNYYYLINGYKELFLNKNSKIEKFINLTRFRRNL